MQAETHKNENKAFDSHVTHYNRHEDIEKKRRLSHATNQKWCLK